MEIQQESRGSVLIVRPIGRVDSQVSPIFEQSLTSSLEIGRTKIVLDCARLDTISSAGLRVILSVAKRMRTEQGQFVLAAVKGSVKEVFEISGFNGLFKIYGTASQAAIALE